MREVRDEGLDAYPLVSDTKLVTASFSAEATVGAMVKVCCKFGCDFQNTKITEGR